MTRSGKQRLKYVLTDWCTGSLAVLLFDVVRYHVLDAENVGYSTLSSFLLSPIILIEQAVLPLLLLAVSALSGFYNRPLLKSRLQEFVTTMFTASLQTILVYFALLTNQQTSVRATNYELLIYLFLILWLFTWAGRLLVTGHAYRCFRKGRWHYGVLIIGPTAAARNKERDMRQNMHRSGFSPAGVIELTAGRSIDHDALNQLLAKPDLQEILFTTEEMSEDDILRTLYTLIPTGLPIKVSSKSLSVLTSSIRLQSIYEEPYVDISSPSISDATQNMKRVIDVLVSSLTLTLLALPMAVVALIVKLTSSGPAIYRQERIGKKQKPFTIYKFRSMRTDAEASGPCLSSASDTRVTTIGAWMRKYRVDELPQFWNVLKGDMSLVGPRPERRYFINLIMQKAPYYSLVHQVRPGITGWGMVKYGYADSIDRMVERLRYDLVYLANISLTNDLKIIIYTIKTVIKGRGM